MFVNIHVQKMESAKEYGCSTFTDFSLLLTFFTFETQHIMHKLDSAMREMNLNCLKPKRK